MKETLYFIFAYKLVVKRYSYRFYYSIYPVLYLSAIYFRARIIGFIHRYD